MRKRDIIEKIVLLVFPPFGLLKNTFKRAWQVFNCYKTVRNVRNSKMKLPMKVAITSGVTFVVIIIFWIALPKLLHSQIKKMVSLKKGNDVRDMYIKVPFPLDFKIYVFNVTNPYEVAQKGATPVVQEIGPFFYEEWKEKVDIEEDESDDTMTYTIVNTFIFNPKKTLPLTGNEIIYLLHPMIAGMAYVVEKDKPGALSLLNKAIISIHKNPEAPFIQAAVKDILFDGVFIYCNVTDFAGKAVCSQLATQATDLVQVEPGIFKFSLFSPKNGTKQQRVKVKRGIENIHDLGRVLEVDGQKELTVWDGKLCNTFEGTDSTIFPPFLTKEEGMVSFAPDICRSLAAYYVEEAKYNGVPVRRYAADFGDMSTIPEQKCYCQTPDTCLKRGVMDLTNCLGAPMIASLPHFYLADPSYANGVRGLNPNAKEHEIIIYFESMAGAPVSAKKRLQFSMPIHPLPKITMMKDLPTTVLPIMWVEEGIDLNSTWTGPLKSLFTVLKVTKVFKIIVLIGSILGFAAAGYLHYSTKTEVQITPVHNDENGTAQRRKDVISMLGQNEPKNNEFGGQINHAMSNNEIDKY